MAVPYSPPPPLRLNGRAIKNIYIFASSLFNENYSHSSTYIDILKILGASDILLAIYTSCAYNYMIFIFARQNPEQILEGSGQFRNDASKSILPDNLTFGPYFLTKYNTRKNLFFVMRPCKFFFLHKILPKIGQKFN